MNHNKEREDAAETKGEAGNFIVFDLRTLTHFREDRPYVQILSESAEARVVLLTFKGGQRLQDQSTASQLVVQALRGRATLSAQGNSVTLKAGMIAQLEEHIPHTILAQTDAVMLLTYTPSPARHGIEAEIFQGCKPLIERVVNK